MLHKGLNFLLYRVLRFLNFWVYVHWHDCFPPLISPLLQFIYITNKLFKIKITVGYVKGTFVVLVGILLHIYIQRYPALRAVMREWSNRKQGSTSNGFSRLLLCLSSPDRKVLSVEIFSSVETCQAFCVTVLRNSLEFTHSHRFYHRDAILRFIMHPVMSTFIVVNSFVEK